MSHEDVVYAGVWFDGFVSSNVAGFGYDHGSQVLRVEFKNSNQYVYLDVPPEVVEAWCDAPSKGKYHAANVKWNYPFSRL